MEKIELPVGWRWVQLVEVLSTMETGARPKGGAIGITEGIPSISAEHMTNFGTFDFSELRYVPFEFYEQMARGHIQIGDSLIVKDGATTGKTCFIDEDFPFDKAVINEHVFICRPNANIIYPRFLFYWLWGNEAQTAIRLNFQGAAIGGINQRFADNVLVPLPPLSEQKRIAAILTDQLAAVERARKASEARLEAARALPAAYLREVFESEEAKTWKIIKLEEIASLVIDGPHITPNYQQQGIPFITIRNIVKGKIDFNNFNYVSLADHIQFTRRGRAEKGDILYTKDGTLGIPCVVDTDREFSFFVSVALIKLFQDKAYSNFIAYALESPSVLKQVKKLGAGMGLKHMVLKSIKSLEIPVPSLEKQVKIASEIKEKIRTVESTQDIIKSELQAINALPIALLRQAFTGNL